MTLALCRVRTQDGRVAKPARTRKRVNLTISSEVEARVRPHAGKRGLSQLTEALWDHYSDAVEKEKSCKPMDKGENTQP